MLEQLEGLFADPKIQEMGKQRLMEMLGGGQRDNKSRIRDALLAAGGAMASTPGNALAGLSQGAVAAGNAYRPQGKSKESGEAALKLMDKLLNYGKAREGVRQGDERTAIQGRNADTARYRADTSARQGDQRQNLAERLGLSTIADREAGNAIAQQNADTSRIQAISPTQRQHTPIDPRKLAMQAEQLIQKAEGDIFKDRLTMSPEEIAAGNEKLKQLRDKLQGIIQSAPAPQSTGPKAPPPKAVEALLQNPDRAAEFDQLFGPGTAAQILKGR